jgi:zinc/manganese transport system substrate-binding protein
MNKQIITIYTLLTMLMFAPVQALAKVGVFACEPEWASLAVEIGGNAVEITSATTAQQDPHHIRAKPSLIAAIRKADILFCSGGGLEEGWLPLLLQRAKSSVQPGSDGYFMASDIVPLLEVPESLDRVHGHLHAQGNPHVHLNPYNITKIASELGKRLVKIDPLNRDTYQQNHDKFSSKWKEAIKTWESDAASLKGKKIIVHHGAFIYLLDWLGITQTATLEPIPGIPPSSSHLQSLLATTQAVPIMVIIRTPYEDSKASEWLSNKTNIPHLPLPYTVGGDSKSKTLFELFDRSLYLLKEVQRAQH